MPTRPRAATLVLTSTEECDSMKVRKRAATALAVIGATALAAIAYATPAAAIVGGTPSNTSDYPYYASFTQPLGVPPSCGGSVIADSWILTAAHCVDHTTVVTVSVSAAGFTGSGTVILHPLWIANQSNGWDGHDVALVQLPAPIPGVTPVQAGAPWDLGAYASGNLATIMGTGDTYAHDPNNGAFLAADTILRSDGYMDDIFNPWYWFDHWDEALMIGAGTTYQTVCHGDSGSPLVVNRYGTIVQVGVSSFIQDGDDCHGAAAFAEVGGPQLAWIASRVPAVMSRWGGCVSPSGAPGQSAVAYGTFVPGFRWDGPYPWHIWCEGPPATVVVPDLRGQTSSAATATLQSVGLVRGTVSSRTDPSCNSIGVVMSQSPARGTVVPPGSVVSFTIGTRPRTPCP
jgi:V8-like Glu-specific endopeptidase